MSDKKRTQTPRTIADAWLKHQDTALALQRLDAHLQEHPRDAAGWLLKGELLLVVGRRRRAIAAFKRALKLDRGLHAARFNLAEAYAEVGDSQLAQAALTEALTRFASELDTYSSLLTTPTAGPQRNRDRRKRALVRSVSAAAQDRAKEADAAEIAREIVANWERL